MSEPATPKISRRPALPLVWVVPIIALLIAGWMVYRQLRNHGPEITIEFATGDGLEEGKTMLEHKGVSVGVVRQVELKKDLSGVLVTVRLTKAGAPLARTGSQFWVVHPEVSFSGIRGLETLVTGVRLGVRPGNGPPATRFHGLDGPPPIDDPSAGRAFVLVADKLGNLTPGSPVYYRGVKVGIIETTRLAANATVAMVRIRVYTPYVNLVRLNSQFWNISGFSFSIGIHGAELKTSTLQSLIAGGVAFATPDTPGLAPTALENTQFVLHDDAQKDWLTWRPRIAIAPVDSTPETPKPDATARAAPPLSAK